jgi:hypothetical protein
MRNKIKMFWLNIRIGLAHARYHKNMKRAEQARQGKQLRKFRRYIYRAENAWRKLVILFYKQRNING